MKTKFLFYAVMIVVLLAGCASPQAATTEAPPTIAPSATSQPTATASPIPPSPTPTPLPITNIVIDGKADDWEKYPVNIADPTGDQKSGMADLIEARFFMNDKYLYLLIKLENGDRWDDMAFALGFSGKIQGQLNLRPSHHVDAGFYGEEFVDLPVDMEAGEYIEVKIPLDRFPGKLQGIFGIRVFNHNQSGDDPVDDSENASRKQLALVKETEPIANADGSAYSGELTLDTTWSGEVHVSGDITLSSGVILTVEPGTTVYLAPNQDDMHRGSAQSDSYIDDHNDPVGSAEWDQNAITIDGRGGTINAIGAADNPIVFRPEGDSASSAQWDGIYIEKGAIRYAKVLYAGRTAIQIVSQKNDGSPKDQVEIAYNEVRFYHWAGIDSHTYNVWIHHNIVEGGGHQAMTVGSGSIAEYNFLTHCQNAMFILGVDVIVRNNIAVDCARGLQISSPRIPAGSAISITNNTVVQMQGPPDGWYYQGKLIYPAHDDGVAISVHVPSLKLNIQNNIISGPFDYGIGLYAAPGSGSVVDYNLFWELGQDFYGNSVGGHNLFSDPMLAEDYSLLPGSPAIDAGSPEIQDSDGSPADLGAFGGGGSASSASTPTPKAVPTSTSKPISTSTPKPTSTPTPTTACLSGETQLFASDFESGTTGWDLDPASAWSVISDGGSKVLQGSGYANARVNASWDQIIWRMKIKIVSGRVQLGFRANGNQRYTIIFDGKSTRLVGSTGSVLDQGNTPHSAGTWYSMEIGFQNNALKVTTDGELEIVFNDSAPHGPGGIWLEVLDGSTFQFDDIRVCQP